ncbi:MAG: hypothetical protein AB2A00_15730 [Myxococcota bacterium]
MQPLPEEEEEALLEVLADCIRGVGVERFLSRHLILPEARFFPDPWEPNARGVGRMVRRLMHHAGLPDDLGVYIGVDTLREQGPELPDTDGAWSSHAIGAPAFFAGVTQRPDGRARCVFGVDQAQLQDPDELAGVLAHEVAHAVRHTLALPVANRDLEEKLTDVTTVVLGFGVLTANNTLRHRSRSDLFGPHFTTPHARTETGYLSPRAMTFLLAAVVEARDLDGTDVRNALEPNQAAWFTEARQRLRTTNVRARLGLGASLPPPPGGPVAPPLPAEEGWLVVVQPERVDEGAPTHPVFRLEQTRAKAGAALGMVLAGLVATTGRWLHLPEWLSWLLLGLGAVLGWWWGARQRWDRCADPRCGAVIPEEALVCPGCRGSVVGRVDEAEDRLAAEELWRSENQPEVDEFTNVRKPPHTIQ